MSNGMTEHKRQADDDIADIKLHMESQKIHMKYQKDHNEGTDLKFTKMFKILEGNGGTGLVTKTALNEQSLRRVWKFVYGIFATIVGIAAFILRKEL